MQSTLAALTSLYRDPVRRYHDLSHIVQMFDVANLAEESLTEVQTLAIWYHDAIYVPGSPDNEIRSAALAYDNLRETLFSPELEKIQAIILDTKTHEATLPESELVLDLDMSILGSHRNDYIRYAKKIREEFAFVPDEIYQDKRSEVLKLFLERGKNSKLFYRLGNKLNDMACANLEWEIESLANK